MQNMPDSLKRIIEMLNMIKCIVMEGEDKYDKY